MTQNTATAVSASDLPPEKLPNCAMLALDRTATPMSCRLVVTAQDSSIPQ